MLIILLDFDGVLNRHDWLGEQLTDCGFGLPPDFTPIDPTYAPLLNAITDATSARIVVSSGWRSMAEPCRCALWLRNAGVTGDILGQLGPTRQAQRRGDVIATWLSEHPQVTAFVCLDDMSRASMMPVQKRLVQTDPNVGLTDELVQRAIAMLTEEDTP